MTLLLTVSCFLAFSLAVPGCHGLSTGLQIKCYDCHVPYNQPEMNNEICRKETYCMGVWCTKGPDAQSNGIYRGCQDIAPVEGDVEMCIMAPDADRLITNCYCNNNDYCNASSTPQISSFVVFLFAIIALIFIF